MSTKEEAYEQYPNLKLLGKTDLIQLLAGAIAFDDEDFAEAIRAILKETK